MKNHLLEIVQQSFPLEEVDPGEFASLNVSVMKFQVKAYNAKGLGRVSVMDAKGMFGLIKMTTLMITPLEKDAPLFSYDAIHAGGNCTLIMELFDTNVGYIADVTSLQDIIKKYSDLTDGENKPHWYDSLHLPALVNKKGKSKDQKEQDKLAGEYLNEYVLLADKAPNCDIELKKRASKMYSEGLISNGGPATDPMKKAIGEEKTRELFDTILFGTRQA